ncbi:PREDICTED: putative GTP-binding protein 6 [Elephantulus edwardii]|uniref:putative GTP-binding protein 6 n=1 Tax=Elephantulus edwardii TaxID=28737 RepID=UPI0003F0DF7E|nr:PREDICTED: putative GTP-binding protein 6 [Elephantulus edwardii]
MWAVRAAVRAGLGLYRGSRGRPAVRDPQLRPGPACASAAFGSKVQGRKVGGWGPRAGGRKAAAQDQGEPEDAHEEGGEEEEEEEELLIQEPLLPPGAQRVCLVHPDIKCGPRKPQLTRAEWQVAEAQALVQTLDGWSVVQTHVVSTRTPDSRMLFGRGNLDLLTERIRGCPEVTAVFLNVEKMGPLTKKALEATWGVQVFDRFTIVLHIFQCNARTREARLQVALAEIPLLRSNLKNGLLHLDAPGAGSRNIMGLGETPQQVGQRVLREREAKIRRALDRLRAKRRLVHTERQRRDLPVIAVVGYTNSGKTTLIRALTGDQAARPRHQLFATLDVTAHGGRLPSQLAVLYVDTIGFLSQLPHQLIASFSATLDDVAQADVVIHVRDVSHPDTELQKASVLSTLRGLQLPASLLESMVEVHNKVDLVNGYSPSEPGTVAVSALRGQGLQELKSRLQDAVLRATGHKVLTLRTRLDGPQLSWLHREATVQDVDVDREDGVAHVTVVISHAALGRFRKLFPG